MKRGQVTVFIIIGIVLLLAIGLIIFLVIQLQTSQVETEAQRVSEVSFERGSIESFVSSCLQDAGKRGAYALALQGGYIDVNGEQLYGEPGDGQPNKAHYFAEQVALPYVVDETGASLRDREELEQVLERFVIVELDACADFSVFQGQGFEVSQPDIPWQAIDFDFEKASVPYASANVNSSATIRANDILLQVSYPLILQRGDETLRFDTFSATVPLRLGTLHSFAQTLTQNILDNQPYKITDDCDEYAASDGLVNVYFVPNPFARDYVIRLVDAKPLISQRSIPLRFQFAVKNVQVSGECAG